MSSFLARLRSWFRPEPELDVRRNVILFDVTKTNSLSWATSQFLCKLLHDKAIERGLSVSMVDFEEFVYDRLRQSRKFHDRGKDIAAMFDDPEMEHAVNRQDIMWLMRNRDRLMREAFSAGGDAEYVFMQFQGNSSDLLFGMPWDMNKRVIKLHYLAHEDTNEGNYVAVLHGKQAEFFKMPEDNWRPEDTLPILEHIIRLCAQPA